MPRAGAEGQVKETQRETEPKPNPSAWLEGTEAPEERTVRKAGLEMGS